MASKNAMYGKLSWDFGGFSIFLVWYLLLFFSVLSSSTPFRGGLFKGDSCCMWFKKKKRPVILGGSVSGGRGERGFSAIRDNQSTTIPMPKPCHQSLWAGKVNGHHPFLN